MAIPGTDLLEVPTMYKAYLFCRPNLQGIWPQIYGLKNGTNIPPIQDPESTIDYY